MDKKIFITIMSSFFAILILFSSCTQTTNEQVDKIQVEEDMATSDVETNNNLPVEEEVITTIDESIIDENTTVDDIEIGELI